MSRKRRKSGVGTHAFGAWLLTPEGAATHPGERTAVVADVHLGYEWARGAAGDCVPAHSLEETLARLESVFARTAIRRLIVAGDLVESASPCHRTAADVRRLEDWLDSRGVSLVVVEGNHDRGRLVGDRASRGIRLPSSCMVGGWTIAHGHRPIAGERTVSGHHHPMIRAGGRAWPCFLAGPARIVLPAFTANAAGRDVLSGPIPREWADDEVRCIASTGSELLDFGPLPALRRAPAAAR